MVYLTMALWLDFGKGYVRVLRNLLSGLRWARGGWDGYTVPTDGAISRARDRLGSAPLKALFEGTAKPTVPLGHEEVFWRGLRKVAVDGTVFDLPASRDNAAAFEIPSGGVLPQARLVALAECGSLALVGATFDSIKVGERTLLERLLGKLTAEMLLLADRGFPSYELYRDAAATGAQLLWRVSDSLTLPVKRRLDDGTYLSELRGKRRDERMTVRVIEYSVSDDDGVSEVFALITTLLDPEQAPAWRRLLHPPRPRTRHASTDPPTAKPTPSASPSASTPSKHPDTHQRHSTRSTRTSPIIFGPGGRSGRLDTRLRSSAHASLAISVATRRHDRGSAAAARLRPDRGAQPAHGPAGCALPALPYSTSSSAMSSRD